MSATSKRDRALAEGAEPVTGKELYRPPPKATKQKKTKKKETTEENQDGS